MGDQSIQEKQPEDDAKGNDVQEDQPSESSSPFFVTISLHSGFRRLHKSGCWGTLPWTCHKVEYVSRVAEGVADAVCKICQRASGGKMEESASSSSGSSFVNRLGGRCCTGPEFQSGESACGSERDLTPEAPKLLQNGWNVVLVWAQSPFIQFSLETTFVSVLSACAPSCDRQKFRRYSQVLPSESFVRTLPWGIQPRGFTPMLTLISGAI